SVSFVPPSCDTVPGGPREPRDALRRRLPAHPTPDARSANAVRPLPAPHRYDPRPRPPAGPARPPGGLGLLSARPLLRGLQLPRRLAGADGPLAPGPGVAPARRRARAGWPRPGRSALPRPLAAGSAAGALGCGLAAADDDPPPAGGRHPRAGVLRLGGA